MEIPHNSWHQSLSSLARLAGCISQPCWRVPLLKLAPNQRPRKFRSLTDLVWYLYPGSGEFTRLKETLHWHILPEPAREVRTLKPRMNSIAKPSWPPGDNCWSLGARGALDQVIFAWGHNLKIPQWILAFWEGNPRTLNIAIIGVAPSRCCPGVLKPAIAAIRIHRSCCCDSGFSRTLVHPEGSSY